MIIGVDIRTLLENYYSGVNFYTLNLLKNAIAQDETNRYKLFANSLKQITNPLWRSQQINLYRYHWPNKLLNSSFTFFRWPKIDHLIGKVDLFFLPNINFYALSKDIPLVAVIYDLSFKYYPEFYSAKRRLWHKITRPTKLLERCQKIITISKSSKQDLIDLYGIPSEKIGIIYPAVDEKFKPLNYLDQKIIAVKQKYQLPENFVLYLGNLEPRKNIESLILAFEQLLKKNRPREKDLFLIIAGRPSWLYQNIFKLARKSTAGSQIKFLGYVAEKDKPALYNLAKVFVYPSFYEGFGLPVLEAMSCGCPIISSASSSLPEVTDDSALLINPYKINELTEALWQIISDENLRRSLKEKGLLQAQNFSWQKSSQKLLDIFKDISK